MSQRIVSGLRPSSAGGQWNNPDRRTPREVEVLQLVTRGHGLID